MNVLDLLEDGDDIREELRNGLRRVETQNVVQNAPNGNGRRPQRGANGTREVDGRKRNWVFTVNNWGESDIERLRQLGEDEGTRYLCYQPEVGESGTRHLQGCVFFHNPRAFNGVRVAIGGPEGRAHIEVMRGTSDEAIDYCQKPEGRDVTASFGFTSFGTVPPAGTGSQGSRTDLRGLFEDIKGGKRGIELCESHPTEFFKYPTGISKCIAACEPKRSWKTEIFWLWGPTGSGKSRFANESCPQGYWKAPEHAWWDGYEGQEDVIIDDYRRDFCKFSSLLRLFDRYPMQLNVKGGTVQFRARRVYISTPFDVRRTWEGRSDEDLQQLLRRVEHQIQFPQLGAAIIENGADRLADTVV